MNIIDAFLYFLNGYQKYFCFKGRATRSAFFSFIFISILFYTGLYYVVFNGNAASYIDMAFIPILLITAIPSVAYCTRRLHDAGISGVWQLLTPTPLFLFSLPLFPILLNNEIYPYFALISFISGNGYLVTILAYLALLVAMLTVFIIFAFGPTLIRSDDDNKYGTADDAVGASIWLKLKASKKPRR